MTIFFVSHHHSQQEAQNRSGGNMVVSSFTLGFATSFGYGEDDIHHNNDGQ